MDNNPELSQKAEEQRSHLPMVEMDDHAYGNVEVDADERSPQSVDTTVASVVVATEVACSDSVGDLVVASPAPNSQAPEAEELLRILEEMVAREQLPDRKEMNRLSRLIDRVNIWEVTDTDATDDPEQDAEVLADDDLSDISTDVQDELSTAESELPRGVTPEMKERFAALKLRYRTLYNDIQERDRSEKLMHLEQKEALLKRLEECLISTFDPFKLRNEFHNIRNEWKEIGDVPEDKRREILDRYEKLVNSFYEQQKLNKEAQEYDFAHNKKEKENLIRRAQDLLMEEDVRKAFRELQYMHDAWKETGPVAPEFRESMWKEFQEVSKAINKRHNEYFVRLHEQEAACLQRKVEIVERMEQIVSVLPTSRDTWRSTDAEVEEIRKQWREVGHVPYKLEAEVRQRFRTAKDEYYRRRRTFMKELSSTIGPKLERMRELVAEAEALKDSTSWKATAEKLKELQREWTEVAQMGTRVGEAQRLWKSFRKACDTFFETRNKDLRERKHQQNDNYYQKLDIVRRLEAVRDELPDNADALVAELQEEWQRIGRVPNDRKDELFDRYYKSIRALTDWPKGSRTQRNDGRKPIAADRKHVRNERGDADRKYMPRVDLKKDLAALSAEQLGDEQATIRSLIARKEEELRKYQTNILFFSASPDNPMVKHVQHKIDLLQHDIDQMQERMAEIKALRKAQAADNPK